MDNKSKNKALIAASVFMAIAIALGSWIRKL